MTSQRESYLRWNEQWLIVTMHRKRRQIPPKFVSLHGKAHVTFRITLMSKFRYGTVAFKSILFLPHSPPIEVELHANDPTYF